MGIYHSRTLVPVFIDPIIIIGCQGEEGKVVEEAVASRGGRTPIAVCRHLILIGRVPTLVSSRIAILVNRIPTIIGSSPIHDRRVPLLVVEVLALI